MDLYLHSYSVELVFINLLEKILKHRTLQSSVTWADGIVRLVKRISKTHAFSPQLPPILMPKYPEYQPLFQSDNSIGSLLWPYMMSSCLTELMSSPSPSRMNGLPPCTPWNTEVLRAKTHEGGYKLTTHNTPSAFNCITITVGIAWSRCQ